VVSSSRYRIIAPAGRVATIDLAIRLSSAPTTRPLSIVPFVTTARTPNRPGFAGGSNS
jgi:hypothetical protein